MSLQYYKYTTDQDTTALIKMSNVNAKALGFVDADGSEKGIAHRRGARHITLREDASPFRTWQFPVPTRKSKGYETLGVAITVTISGKAVPCHTVGSHGEKYRFL